MKNNKIYRLFYLLAVVSLFSCTDLEEEPKSRLSPESVFKTEKDVELVVLGAYSPLASEGFYGRKLTLTLELLGDMGDIGNLGTPARRRDINNFNATSTNGMLTNFWPKAYEIIAAANTAIAGADVLSGSIDESKLSPYRAEARFLRAFTYYHLVRIFGEVPLIDFAVDDPESLLNVSKSSVDDIYTSIIADLEYAKENLPETNPQGSRSRPSKATAAAYLASVALTRKDYQKAASEAEYVINNKDNFNVGLIDNYQDLFLSGEGNNDLKEHLFSVDFLANTTGSGNVNVDWWGSLTGVSGSDQRGWSVCVPALRVFETWDSRDYRRSVAFWTSALVNGVEVPYTDPAFSNQNVYRPHIAKYNRFRGEETSVNGGISDNNYAAMRYAEVLLIAAEALNEINGPTATSIDYVNQVRARARNADGVINTFPEDVNTSISKDAFKDLIIDERRLELSFEFKRWYDIKRLALGNEVFKGANSLEPHDNFDASKDYLLPLPQSELDMNPNLLPQNPGY